METLICENSDVTHMHIVSSVYSFVNNLSSWCCQYVDDIYFSDYRKHKKTQNTKPRLVDKQKHLHDILKRQITVLVWLESKFWNITWGKRESFAIISQTNFCT